MSCAIYVKCKMRGDRWLNPHSKQVSCAMYVRKDDLFFAIFCAGFPPYFFLNIKLPFWEIDGATPTHLPKSGWECPHRWRNSAYLPISINQLNQNMPHRSELPQDRRQNHQERHQSYPKTGGKTTRKDIRVMSQKSSLMLRKKMERNQRRRWQKICHFLGHRWLNWPVLKGVQPSIPHFFWT